VVVVVVVVVRIFVISQLSDSALLATL
jgi:hypothetical protein